MWSSGNYSQQPPANALVTRCPEYLWEIRAVWQPRYSIVKQVSLAILFDQLSSSIVLRNNVHCSWCTCLVLTHEGDCVTYSTVYKATSWFIFYADVGWLKS